MNVTGSRFKGEQHHYPIDDTNPFIIRDYNKCVLCERCIRACDELQGITAIDYARRGFNTKVGTPFDVYNRPATAFVASFIGSTNVLYATILDPEKGRVIVDGQEIAAAGPLPGIAGQEVRFTVRPESIALNNGVPANNHLAGTLSNVIFLGSIVRLVIRAGQSELLIDTFNNPHLALPALGSSVTVGFAPEACVLLN